MSTGIAYGYGVAIGKAVRISRRGDGSNASLGSPEGETTPFPVVALASSLVDLATASLPDAVVAVVLEEAVSPYSHDASRIWGLRVPVLSGLAIGGIESGADVSVDFDRGRLDAPAHCQLSDGPRVEHAPFRANLRLWAEIEDPFVDAPGVAVADGVGVINVEDLVALGPALAPRLIDLAFGHRGARAIRTFDSWPRVGAAHAVMHEDYLGFRGVRLARKLPDYYERFLEVIAACGCPESATVVLPMVTDPADIEGALKALEKYNYRLGITVENPAAVAVLSDLISELVLVEIGLNDLSQYVMAWDRDLPNDDILPWYEIAPAVLPYIEAVAESCNDSRVELCIGLDLRPSLALARQIESVGVGVLSAPAALMLPWTSTLGR